MLSGGTRPKASQHEDGEVGGSQMSGVQVVLGSYKEKIEQLGDMMVKIQEVVFVVRIVCKHVARD